MRCTCTYINNKWSKEEENLVIFGKNNHISSCKKWVLVLDFQNCCNKRWRLELSYFIKKVSDTGLLQNSFVAIQWYQICDSFHIFYLTSEFILFSFNLQLFGKFRVRHNFGLSSCRVGRESPNYPLPWLTTNFNWGNYQINPYFHRF